MLYWTQMNLDYVESNEHRMERNDDRANMMNEQEEQKSNMKCHVFYEKNHIRTLHNTHPMFDQRVFID